MKNLYLKLHIHKRRYKSYQRCEKFDFKSTGYHVELHKVYISIPTNSNIASSLQRLEILTLPLKFSYKNS